MSFKFRTLPLAFTLVALVALTGVHLRYVRMMKAEEFLRVFISDLHDRHFADAQQKIENSLKLSPNNAHYLSNAGLLHERMLQRSFDFESFRNPQLGDADSAHIKTAIEFYKRALELNPYDDHTAHNLGWLSWLVNQRQDAFNYLQRATDISGDIPLYHISLGLLREYTGDFDAAYKEYAQAIRISPGVVDSQFFMDLRSRSPAQAEKIVNDLIGEFQEQVQRGGGPTVKAKLGKLLLDRQPDAAERVLQEATAALSNLSRTWTNLGWLYEQRGEGNRAELSYKKAIFIDGGETQVFFRLGKYYDDKQRTQDAINFYRRAVQSWIDPLSLHASRVRRIYASRSAVRDDVIPKGFSAYTNPALDFDWTCERLATLYRQTGNPAQAEQYEKLRKEYVP
jgi:tetratricopeptide (TPR) repeat protein